MVEHPKDEAQSRLSFISGSPFGFTTADATAPTGAWVAGLEAEANAILGRPTETRRAIDRAQLAWSRQADDVLTRPRTAFFDSARLAGDQGICLTRLGQPAEAQAVLRSAIATLDRNQGKSRSGLLRALGIACAQSADVDEACRIGAEALDLAVGMGRSAELA